MNESERIMAWLDDRLEAYVDGDLPEHERCRIERLLAGSDEASEQLALAQGVSAHLSALSAPPCPPEITRSVLAQARAESRANLVERLVGRFESAWETFLRPSLAAALLVLLVVAGALVGPSRGPAPATEAAASPAEVEQALHDAKWALAFVTQIGKQTGQSIRRDVLEERVAVPVQRALGQALDGEPNS